MANLTELLESIAEDQRQSWKDFEDLRKPGIVDHPIPFFGPADKARVLTVGVNPSWTEFRPDRGWPSGLNGEQLAARLRAYFTIAPVSIHKWFDPWREALNELGVDYGAGAAHIDQSPRASISMGDCPPNRFLAMIEHDVKWFFKLLSCWQQARVILLAGTVTKREYMNRFVARVAPLHGFSLRGKPMGHGKAPVDFHTLAGYGRNVPVFFCGVSPSARNPSGLVRRVQEHRARLRRLADAEAISESM